MSRDLEQLPPQGITLRPTKWKQLGLLVISVLLFGGGVLGIVVKTSWESYLCAAFFGLCTLIGVLAILPGATYLRVSENGVTFCNLFRETSIPWHLVQRFSVVGMNVNGLPVRKVVGIHFAESVKTARIGRGLVRFISGCEGSLPDTYGRSAAELADFLNRCLVTFQPSDDEPSPSTQTNR